jgi:acetyl-CoA synthetase
MSPITAQHLEKHGLPPAEARSMALKIDEALRQSNPAESWRIISKTILRPEHPFAVHRFLYETVFADWKREQGPPPAWSPTAADVEGANVTAIMRQLKLRSYAELHAWSVRNREAFWELAIERLGVRFRRKYSRVMDLSEGVESPRWLVDAKLNIAESCFTAPPASVAIVYQAENGPLQTMTVRELESLTNRVANAFAQHGFKPGDALAIDMPMTAESVAIYLGIVKAGGVVVSIADSFVPREIATRLRLGNAKAIFTQDVMVRGGKTLPLYEKVIAANAPMTIVLPEGKSVQVGLRAGDLTWEKFLNSNDRFEAVSCDPHAPINIMFSSGTTGDPKAIVWMQNSPIKGAVDALLHQDVRPGDVIAWPTNLGWMMGPWLIFASLINRCTIALYYGAPTGGDFGRFVQDAKVTMLGVVPSMIKSWRARDCMKGLDWSAIKLFSSTGEASNAEDYLYCMSLAGYKPIIEYCGGTEIGGGYITGVVVRPTSPATFSTLHLGLDAVILDENGKPCDNGELFLIPPSIGLSTTLLNKDHHEVYFEGTPKGPNGETLRRHGDQMERLLNGYYRAHGRVDDTMNLGGIKVSSAEIEQTLQAVPGVTETAAIAIVPPGGGPSLLVIYAVCSTKQTRTKEQLMAAMQNVIKQNLNPLFKISDVVLVDALPRTASNKVMRRVLRDQYDAKNQQSQ